MSAPNEVFPIAFPNGAPHPYQEPGVARRVARVAELGKGSRVLAIDPEDPAGLLALVRELGCEAFLWVTSDALAAAVEKKVESERAGGRIEVRRGALSEIPFDRELYDLILLQGEIPMPFEAALERFRRGLHPGGRLAMLYPVRVGRQPPRALLDHWERRLGEPLRKPAELLSVMWKARFEPESAESLSVEELSALHRSWREKGAAAEGVHDEEMTLMAEAASAGASYALFIGCRRD